MERRIADIVQAAATLLAASGHATAKLDTEYLLAHVLGCERMALYSREAGLTTKEQRTFDGLISRRATGEPVAYITGTQAFWTLDLKVNEHTLIPRPDTETLVETVLHRAGATKKHKILDLGTGSGCILLSLLSEWSSAGGVGADISVGALAVAAENAQHCGVADRVAFTESHWFDALEKPAGGFSVIVSNPPYIPAADIDSLMVDVRAYEPLSALNGGEDGLNPYRIICEKAGAYLGAAGLLAVEIGIYQAADVGALMQKNGFIDIEITKDLAGIERVVSAKNVK